MYQSLSVQHIYETRELCDMLDSMSQNVNYDTRPKIEDLDGFRRYMTQRNLWSDEFERELNLYLKFYNI